MRLHKFIIPKNNPDDNPEVVVTEAQIKLIYLEAKGFNQQDAADHCGLSRGTAHNALTDFDEQTGCHNAQGRVGWALEHGLLILENELIVIAPKYVINGKNGDTEL
jgi:hypothetical protein